MSAVALDSDRPGARAVSSRRRLIVLALLVLAVLAIAAGAWWSLSGGESQSALDRGLAALNEGELAMARKCVMELRASPGHESEATLLRGAMLVKMGYYYPGLDELGKVTDDAALKERALALSGEAWYYLGRHVEAQESLKQVVGINPDSIEAHRWLAASYYDMGAITDALVHLQRSAELDPTDHRPLRLVGLIYKDFERYEDAVPAYKESLRRLSDQPGWETVRQELATSQAKMRSYRDALQTLDGCPPTPGVLVLQAECLHALDETEQAKAHLQRALQAEGENLDALVLQGSIALEEAKYDQAIEALQRATAKHPKDYMAHFKLAQTYAQAKEPELAAGEQKVADHLREVRKLFADLHQAAWNDPQDRQVRLRLAQLAKELDRPDLEQIWLKAAAALQPRPEPEGPSE